MGNDDGTHADGVGATEARLHANPDLVRRIEDAEAHPERRVPRPDQGDGAGSESDLIRLRRQLMSASRFWYGHFEVGLSGPEVPGPETRGKPGDVMAGSYAYTLAAILKAAEMEAGLGVAERLGDLASEILENGDFDNWNADVADCG